MARSLGAGLAGAVLALLLAEGAARLVAPAEIWAIWPPGLDVTLEPAPAAAPGISGPARFRVGSLGLRGAELAPDDAVVLVALGGSTTECLLLDEPESWPARAAERLGQRLDERVWIGNGGRSGHGTREHLLQLPRVLDAVPRVRAVLLLTGANDLLLHLERETAEERARAERPRRILRRAFASVPRSAPGLAPLDRLELVRRVAALRRRLLLAEQGGHDYRRWRALRAQASRVRSELPELAGFEAGYRGRLGELAALARSRGVALLAMTQPALWRQGLSPDERALLWMGGVGDFKAGGAAYYAPEALARGLARTNAVLLSLCEEGAFTCLDLAARVPRTTRHFYDDVHFTEVGAARVAREVADALARVLSRGG